MKTYNFSKIIEQCAQLQFEDALVLQAGLADHIHALYQQALLTKSQSEALAANEKANPSAPSKAH